MKAKAPTKKGRSHLLVSPVRSRESKWPRFNLAEQKNLRMHPLYLKLKWQYLQKRKIRVRRTCKLKVHCFQISKWFRVKKMKKLVLRLILRTGALLLEGNIIEEWKKLCQLITRSVPTREVISPKKPSSATPLEMQFWKVWKHQVGLCWNSISRAQTSIPVNSRPRLRSRAVTTHRSTGKRSRLENLPAREKAL